MLALAVAAVLLVGGGTAAAAGPPQIVSSWVTGVTATGATLRAEINANGLNTSYRFEYIAEAAYEANLNAVPPREGFFGAAKAPPGNPAGIGSSTTPLAVAQSIGALTPITSYRFRPVASNSAGSIVGPERRLTTQGTSLVFRLPDDRAWEMVSPVGKNGGAIAAPETLFGGGDFQAAAGGSAVTYGSATAFGDAAGAPPSSQYVSRRTAAGWVTENVSTPLESAAYGDDPDGAPYRLFSADLARGLMFGGLPCRGGLEGCPAPNPVLPGTGAPPGYMAYYLREGASGKFASLLTAADLAHSVVSPESFEVAFAGASPDLSVVVLSSCARLTENAKEVLAGPGKCDPDEQNLYRRDALGLRLVSFSSGGVGAPGAEIAAPIGAISEDGARIYWMRGDDLFLHQDVPIAPVDETVAKEATFETASANGVVAFFSKEGHLYSFTLPGEAIVDLTPAGGVLGVLGASADGADVYYQDAGGLRHWHDGTTTTVAPGASAAAPSNFPPATGTARVSPDGERLAFLSTAELTPFDNAGQSEVYLYGALPGGGGPQLVCASCNPTGERPQGLSSIPGALVNGSTQAYKPRVLSASGARLFFDSADELVVHDTNSHTDVYQWEAAGVGGCKRAPGCISLISSGRSLEGARFIDASASGNDAYFITDGSLVGVDPGAVDLYDARVGGGFAEPQMPIACVADACQPLPAPPDDPAPGTLIRNAGNPPPHVFKERRKKRKRAKGKRRGQRKGHGTRRGRETR